MAEAPTTTTVPPAPAAPAQSPPPAAAPAPSETPPVSAKHAATAPEVDPWSARLLQDLGVVVEGDTVKKIEAAPEKSGQPVPEGKGQSLNQPYMTLGEMAKHMADKKAEAEAAAAAAAPPVAAEEKPADKAPDKPADKPPEKKKVEVVKEPPLEHLVEGLVKKFSAPPVATPPIPPKPAVSPEPATSGQPTEDQFLQSLTSDVQREEFEFAQYAAKNMPEKYKDMPAKTMSYFKKIDDYIASKIKEDPSWDPNSDEDYGQFIEDNRPTFSRQDRRTLERKQIADEVRKDVRAEYEPVLEENRQAIRAQQIEPAINETTKNYEAYVLERMATEDKSPLAPIAKLIQEKGWAEGESEDKLAVAAIKAFATQAQGLAKEYMRVDLKAKKYSDQEHGGLFNWIDTQAKAFKKNGGDLTKREGKSFVTRQEWEKLPEADQTNHWTFSTYEVLDMLATMAINSAKSAYNEQIQALTAAGYERKPKAAVPPKEEKAKEPAPRPASPKAIVTASPGAAPVPATNGSGGVFTQEELNRYLTPGAARMR